LESGYPPHPPQPGVRLSILRFRAAYIKDENIVSRLGNLLPDGDNAKANVVITSLGFEPLAEGGS